MAFGLGFNKNKILQAAEKYVLQGKVQAAITEYNKILQKDPQDLMTLNTIGDLYVRAGQNDAAIKCFYELAEKYLEAGNVARSIAVYKRVTKLDAAAVPALLKLGELYFMQGLTRDSRTNYLQAVELHMRRGEKENAREVFERILLLDMENPKLQARMAELYAETGKPQEAVATYLGAAERFLDRNDLGDAESVLQALLRLDAGNLEGNSLLGRLYVEQEKYAKAIATLTAIPNRTEHKGALNWLFHAYRKQADLARTREVAQQLFDLHEDFAGLAQICVETVAGGNVEEAFGIYAAAAERLLAQRAFSGLIEGLRRILAAEPSHRKALELLWEAQQQAGNRGEAQEVAELLGNVYVEEGELEKAREVYAKLVEQEPEDQELRQLLQQVEARQHGPLAEASLPPSLAVAADEVPVPVEQPAASEEKLPPREQEIVQRCLTESELFVNYHLISQAIEVLEKGLEAVPGNMTLYEQLLPLYERSQQYQKAATCAEALTEGYVNLEDGERAARYGELILTYQQKAQESAGAVTEVIPSAMEPTETAAPSLAGSPPAEESQVREIDLSQEWAALSSPGEAASASASVESTVEEVEFYLQAGLTADAVAALERLQGESPAHPAISGFQERLVVLQGGAAPVVETPAEGRPVTEQGAAWVQERVEEPEVFPLGVPSGAALETPGTEFLSEPEAVVSSPPAPVEALRAARESALPAEEWKQVSAAAPEKVKEAAAPPAAEPVPEGIWGEPLPPLEPVSPAPSFELELVESHPAERIQPAKAKAPAPPQDRLAALAGELDEALQPSAAPAPPKAAPTPARVSPPEESRKGFLEDIFAEFREEVEEPATTEGDIETHYNMGVAFKEMALYDEAIGEFQKAHQIAGRKKDYSHLVQYCSLLAACFLEKGLPQLAVKWYQTALNAPGLDAETSLALLYEVGAAYEIAGDRAAALRSFLEVYARNIDYRNVADRIRDLQQSQ